MKQPPVCPICRKDTTGLATTGPIIDFVMCADSWLRHPLTSSLRLLHGNRQRFLAGRNDLWLASRNTVEAMPGHRLKPLGTLRHPSSSET